jgi:secreted trypsin-like serine protease
MKIFLTINIYSYSGGPLVMKGSDGKPIQIGISTLNFGHADYACTEGYANGFTQVNKIIRWIKESSDAPIE